MVRRAAPLSPQLLNRVHDMLDLSKPVDAVLWALVLLAFFTLSRKSNLVVTGNKKFDRSKQLCRSDVLVCEIGLLVQFRWSKTIQYGGRVLLIPVLSIPNSPLCPLVAYTNMLRLVPAQGSDPAFGVNVDSTYHPVTYQMLQRFIKTSVAKLGLDPGLFSSHSLRRAGASWAFRARVPEELIKTQGDWASQVYLRYLEFSLSERCQVAQRMMLEIQKEGLWLMLLWFVSGRGGRLVLTDSLGKYARVPGATVKAFPGETLTRLADRIKFKEVEVSRVSRILLHVGTNDIANLLDSGRIEGVTPQELLRRFTTLRSVIRRRNSNAVLLFSSVLPRLKKFAKYKPYASGLNFALEKMCAKSQGACIYIPSYRNFLRGGRPREELFARDGLHLNGAGVDCLEACFQQALSTAYLTDRVTAARTRRMAKLGYWGGSIGLALRVWPLVRVEIVGLEFPVKWVFWLPCGARAPAWCKRGRVPPLGLFFGFAEAVGLAAVLLRLPSPWEPRE